METNPPITELLHAHKNGEAGAFDQLVEKIYDDLRRLARAQRRGAALETTALVHESYLKLSRSAALDARDRSHFFAVASTAMRQVVVDHAKSRLRGKRGGGAHHTALDEHDPGASSQIDTVLAVDQLLSRLAETHPRTVQVVECRYFTGLSEEETADALGVSARTVQREWRSARKLLRAYLEESRS